MDPSIDTLFRQWRAFEAPAQPQPGVPDYSAAAMQRQLQSLEGWLERLDRLERQDGSDRSVGDRIDLALIRAEIQGLDFNLRVLQPWSRDPAFYKSLWTSQSDTPAHEGPTHHGAIELWQYRFPLQAAAATQLAAQLATIQPLLDQARDNLRGEAGDLWGAGIPAMQEQASALAQLAGDVSGTDPALERSIATAHAATLSFVAWLVQQAPRKTGASGVGRAHYSWYVRNVHLVPLDWEGEVALLERELARAHASLRLEEHRNRLLPPLRPIASEQEYRERTEASVDAYMAFLSARQILPVRDYMAPALRAQTGRFVEPARRNFFAIVRHLEPMVLWCHWYHWFEVAQAERDPHPRLVRRGPLLYNIWDNRAEGLATAMEEMMLHAGLFDDNPRARELVWVMLAQRAARGLAALHAQANTMTLAQAQDFHVRHTPRGWMRADLPLLQFEQHLYLRQPGYGSSYVTGKFLVEQLLAEHAAARGDQFRLADFFAHVGAAGVIPVSLLRQELCATDDPQPLPGCSPALSRAPS